MCHFVQSEYHQNLQPAHTSCSYQIAAFCLRVEEFRSSVSLTPANIHPIICCLLAFKIQAGFPPTSEYLESPFPSLALKHIEPGYFLFLVGAIISGLYLDDGKIENIVEHLRLVGYKMRTNAQSLESHCKIEFWFFSLVYAEISERWPAFLEQILKNESTWYCSKIQKVSIHQLG